MKCGEMSVVAALWLLIARGTAKRKGMFHTHSLILNPGVEFVHEVCPNHEFGELRGHQWPDLIGEALNEGDFEGLVVKVIMLGGNAQELSIVFLKTVIFLLAGLQFELSLHG